MAPGVAIHPFIAATHMWVNEFGQGGNTMGNELVMRETDGTAGEDQSNIPHHGHTCVQCGANFYGQREGAMYECERCMNHGE